MKKCENCGAGNLMLQEDGWETTTDFCSSCGNKLREKCPQCSEMERIGRPFCEQEAKEIKKQLLDIQDKWKPTATAVYCLIFALYVGGFIFGATSFIEDSGWLRVLKAIAFALTAGVWIYISDLFTFIDDCFKKQIKQSQQEFLEANPQFKKKHELWWNWVRSEI